MPENMHDDQLDPAIRTRRYTYVAYNNGERELYDLESDPYQLQSIEPTAGEALIDALATRLILFKACSGQECRNLEDQPME